jgi:DNA-binding transcriptional ArsR family regulator
MAEPMSLSDPRSLRVLAHPVRTRLLYEIGARGSARVVDLAAALEVAPNAASFHLRELAKYGLIVRDDERAGDGRERWWKLASPDGLRFRANEMLEREGGRAALDAWRGHATARQHLLVDRLFALMESDTGDAYIDWTDLPTYLTDEEARQMGREIGEVAMRWLRHGRDRQAAGDAEGRRTYFTQIHTAPQDLLDPPHAEPGEPPA